MNPKKILSFFGLFIVFLLIISIWVYHLDTESFTKVTNITNIIIPVVAFANLTFIIVFYYNDKSLRTKEEQHKNKLYWYRTYVTEKNMEAILQFFGECFQITDEVKQLRYKYKSEEIRFSKYRAEVRSKFGTYTEQRMELRKSFVDFIGIIDADFEVKVNSILEKYENDFTNMLDFFSRDRKEYKDLVNLVVDQKKMLLKEIYNYEMNMTM